jgi:hypothetical protein
MCGAALRRCLAFNFIQGMHGLKMDHLVFLSGRWDGHTPPEKNFGVSPI